MVYQIMEKFDKIKERIRHLRNGGRSATSTRETEANTMVPSNDNANVNQNLSGNASANAHGSNFGQPRSQSSGSGAPTLLTNRSEIHDIDILSYKLSAIPLIYFSFFASFFGTLSNTMLRALVIIFSDDFINHRDEEAYFGTLQVILMVILNIVLMLISLFYLNK